jgi:hypothetical protein
MAVRIGKQRLGERLVMNGDATRHVHLLDGARAQRIDEGVRIEPMVRRIQVDVLDIEQGSGTALPADQVEKLRSDIFEYGHSNT